MTCPECKTHSFLPVKMTEVGIVTPKGNLRENSNTGTIALQADVKLYQCPECKTVIIQ